MPASSRRPANVLVDKIRSLLAARGLTLAEICRKSRFGSPDRHLHHIPHNLFDAIRKRPFTPSVYQVAALSIFSGYRFVDWLELFGFSLDDVPRFQASFSALRTVELDARVYHPRAMISWFRDGASPPFSGFLVPLSQCLSSEEPRQVDSLTSVVKSAYRFVKIGSRDAFAFPELLPGSIVRVKPLSRKEAKLLIRRRPGRSVFLLEHASGLVCSAIYRSTPDRFVLCSRHLPYASVELELGTQANVGGAADVEIRRITGTDRPMVPKSLGGYWKPAPLPAGLEPGNVGKLLYCARKRSGLSFREASKRTRVIAKTLGDPRYFCALGSLSDYETRKLPPRHIHKLISVCAVYFASAAGFLGAAGVPFDALGKLPMPPALLQDAKRDRDSGAASPASKFLKEIEHRFHELPYFLHSAMPLFFGIRDLSVRDVFWTGRVPAFLHPYLRGAAFLIVDRKRKKPRSSLACPRWAQPVYVFLRRDGSYLCGSCTLENGVLIIHSFTEGMPKLIRLQNHIDAEVVGQVVGVVRRLK